MLEQTAKGWRLLSQGHVEIMRMEDENTHSIILEGGQAAPVGDGDMILIDGHIGFTLDASTLTLQSPDADRTFHLHVPQPQPLAQAAHTGEIETGRVSLPTALSRRPGNRR